MGKAREENILKAQFGDATCYAVSILLVILIA